MEIITKNAQATYKLGRKLGNTLKSGGVLGLVGDLGSGKTTFVQGLAMGLGIKERLISPTFILLREYQKPSGGNLYHVDLYRLEQVTKDDLATLGILDFAKDKKNVILVEWADKAKSLLPENTIWVNFENLGENERRITIPD
ncbi:MAG: tRNA (adenosine(37)-N6)-threonylcarbamoyltransferase complex ATPase subunit type 1 TsaE [Candidatus Blackburnbacteria bacterium RIFCSPHIGHO2_01_FULL_43_15b]|uniref:tRNA threonylcarbamoyladenosine biosynthesis protein TsaE n=1 Tax=Candidatus Blackburnbacteria bacterium RIFCSPHIGHO2_01_FULL_43_15b TaxID=1797513 RepID=A0A1G1UZY6_9BACT|nr:MAG: tRNA (adenosine(37)-N6)-threonylcarbamoyltransferase complex ATPase subunit type 1 TsaE [Candidatus Blackburnbacteria bacterium RIFCSPHIGHO2_01_FULL_43_15b]